MQGSIYFIYSLRFKWQYLPPIQTTVIKIDGMVTLLFNSGFICDSGLSLHLVTKGPIKAQLSQGTASCWLAWFLNQSTEEEHGFLVSLLCGMCCWCEVRLTYDEKVWVLVNFKPDHNRSNTAIYTRSPAICSLASKWPERAEPDRPSLRGGREEGTIYPACFTGICAWVERADGSCWKDKS